MSLEKVELRYIFDCENNKNILQYRNITDTCKEPWIEVPVVYSLREIYPKDDSEKVHV